MSSEQNRSEKCEMNPAALRDVNGGGKFQNEPHCKKCKQVVKTIGIIYRCVNFRCSELDKNKNYTEVDWY